MSFAINRGKGFTIDFPNGVCLSTQFGAANYCENKDNFEDFDVGKYIEYIPCKNVEIAIWDNKGVWITKKILNHDNDVKGWVEIDEWLDIFDKCRNYKGDENV